MSCESGAAPYYETSDVKWPEKQEDRGRGAGTRMVVSSQERRDSESNGLEDV